jgi:cation transport ATPase
MGLATPVALWGGLARLARFGLVARSADFLDRLAAVDVLCIDKTGTLSTDRLLVRGWHPSAAFSGRTDWLRAAVSAAEEGLSHPVAGALGMAALTEGERFQLRGRELVPAAGVLATLVDPAGVPVEVAVGEWTMGGRYPAAGDEPEASPTPSKRVHVYVDGAHAAVVELEESWREGLVETLVAIRARGVAVEVLSGDDQAEVAVRRALGGRVAVGDVMVSPGMTPLEKKQRVDALLRAGRSVLFVGDGINDAAAMSAASASVAVRSGTELARASAMAVLAGDDLRALPAALDVAREARAGIRQNLLFAATYNAAGMVLAAGGLLHPIAAAFLMVGSSLFVSVRALRSTHRDAPDLTRPAPPGAG